MDLSRILAAPLAAAALVLTPVAPALAQDTAPEDEVVVDDEMLTSFVMAAIRVAQVAESYQAQIAEAADDSARQNLQQQAQQEMVAAVQEAEGITLQEYVAIGEAAQQDAALNERVMQRLEDIASQQ